MENTQLIRSLIVSLVLMSFGLNIQAMTRERGTVDESGYTYKDESAVSDKRNIAILAYGSLVNQPQGSTGVTLKARYPFKDTSLTMPVGFTRISSANTPKKRVTAVIDTASQFSRPLYATQSDFKFLPNARQNLAAREGTALRSASEGYDLKYTPYMKKLTTGRAKDSNEAEIPGIPGWVVRLEEGRLKLPDSQLKRIAQWAQENGFSAVIWASYPSTHTQQQILDQLRQDRLLLDNTKAYIRNMPGRPEHRMEIENRILGL